jgi:hypothetical protein
VYGYAHHGCIDGPMYECVPLILRTHTPPIKIDKSIVSVCVELLTIDMMIDVYHYGLSRVISLPRLDVNREYVIVTIQTIDKVITLTCTRRMPMNVYSNSIK